LLPQKLKKQREKEPKSNVYNDATTDINAAAQS
jgi:hypothetical protein